MTRGSRRAAPILGTLLVATVLTALVFRFVDLRSDMADFLPVAQTEAGRLMLQQLRSGAATSLILIGIEDAPAEALAGISRRMADTLDGSGLFGFVSNGQQGLNEADQRFLFAHRYALSPATVPDAFSAAALRTDLERLLRQLQSSAAPLVPVFGLADPPAAFPALIEAWIGGSRVRSIDGVWMAPERDRALILARTRANGLDLPAQDRAIAAIDAAFAQAADSDTAAGSARLLVSGPATFARDAANGIRADVRMLSIVSTALIAALLIWRFRSVWVVAAIAVPIVFSIGAATLAVQFAFGFVHGITLGFGMTMLGITVDYPVLLIGHRKQAERAVATLARIGPAFNLAVVTAALGLTGMVFSGFPGISQLGVFSVTGLVVAAATTRFVLPHLIVAADLAPVSAGDPVRLLRIERLRRFRLLALLPVAAAVALLAVSPPRIEQDLAALSPVPQRARDLDDQMRSEIGAPDAGEVIVVRGDTAEDVLRREEALSPRLDRLQADHVIDGAEIAARLLPSAATQNARRAALPDADTLAARLREAQAALPFRADAFATFAADVAAARAIPPLTLSDIESPLLASRMQTLLFPQDGGWVGLIVPRGVADSDRVAAAFADIPGVTAIDIAHETNAIVAAYTGQAWRWLSYGGGAAVLALAIGLRDPVRIGRVLLALAAAGVATVAALAAFGQRLSLLHIVSLQLVGGVGLDYALFFARRQLDAEERARTLRTLATCITMTLLTFGLLGACRTPLLRDIGITVAIGASAAMAFAFLFIGQRTTPPRPGAT